MKLFDRTIQKINTLKRKSVDRASLQLRLTLGITTVSLLGVGIIGIGTTWQMRQILVVDHQNYLKSLGDQLSGQLAAQNTAAQNTAQQDTMQASTTTLKVLLDDWRVPGVWIWAKGTEGNVLATSPNLISFPGNPALIPQDMMPQEPTVSAMNGRYWVLRSLPLKVNGKTLGQLYLAQDITRDYSLLNTLVTTLTFATALAIAIIATLIAYFIWRSLHPLRQMNRMAIGQAECCASSWDLDQVPSEVKGLVQAFGTLSTRLSEADAQQRQFTNSISHEIRTSLSLVYGYLQSTLRRCNNLTESQKEALEVAVEETERTIQLLKDLLDLARINSGTMEFDLEPVVLNDLVPMVVDMIQSADCPPIDIQIPVALVVAKTDPGQLIRVLKHLIDNAIRYAKTDKPIAVILKESPAAAIIQVSDRGCGISSVDQMHIFEPFYRVEASRCRSTGGIGLGLAIAKALVEGMHGEIKVQSQLGEGSTFTLFLPLGCPSTP